MTREHKLALIIGFSLVLLMGVLISDHFSRAGAITMAGVTELDGAAAPEVVPVSREDLGPVLERQPRREQREPTPQSPEQIASNTTPADSVPGGGDGGRTGTGWPDPDQFTRRETPTPAAKMAGETVDWVKKYQESQQNLTQAPQDDSVPPTDSGAAEPARTPPPVREPEAAPKPTFADYTVKNGESLFQIAARHLGDGNRWREIRDANPKSVKSDGTVRSGVRLRIPLSGAAPIHDPLTSAPKEQPKTAPAQKPATKPAAPSRAPTYTVKSGESLGEIAIRTLGTSRRASEIATLNGLKNPNHVRVGMVLKIPQG